MAFINKQDTDGTKPTLLKGELGYDDYTDGGDTGRVYVGTGEINIPLALKSDGVVNDAVVSPADGWSSEQIYKSLNGVDNASSLEYDSEGTLLSSTNEKLGKYIKQELNYTEGIVTSTIYLISDDNTTFTQLGTEPLNYDASGNLTGTTWTEA